MDIDTSQPRINSVLGSRAVVRLPVRFDDAAVEAIRSRLTALAADASVEHLVLDGGDVEEVAGRALGLLVALRHRRREVGASFLIDRPSEVLTEAIENRGLRNRLLPTSSGQSDPTLDPAPFTRRTTWSMGVAANA